MADYSIKELEVLSGIKAGTIRIWEQRYNLLNPARTSTNIRTYSDDDLKRILQTATLVSAGHKISKIAAMRESEIKSLLDHIYQGDVQITAFSDACINQIIEAGTGFKEALFDKSFNNALLRLGLLKTTTEVLYPMLHRIGMLWSQNELIPSQEHFISGLVRQKLITAIDALPLPSSTLPGWILFLPEDEYHEIALILTHYILKSHGYPVIYLGQSVPTQDLGVVIDSTQPKYLVTSITRRFEESSLFGFVDSLHRSHPQQKLLLITNPINLHHQLDTKNLIPINSVEDFLKFV